MSTNCLASTSIGCIFCCQGCSAEKLRNAFTFLPPPRSYDVQKEPSEGAGDKLSRLVFVSDDFKSFPSYRQAAALAEVRFLKTGAGNRIPIVWLRREAEEPTRSQPPAVLLHCHGNATDVGIMMGPYLELSRQLGVDVVGVEYSGYGLATGAPSTGNTLLDLEAAYEHVLEAGVPPERIVAYGQSVGCGPVMGLASKRQLGGVVLHSPMLSGIRVIDPDPNACCRPSCVYRCFDFFPNERRMRTADCPAFVIHGQKDDVIPFHHGSQLARVAPKQHRWPGYFPEEAGHNDIVERDPFTYFERLRSFMRCALQRPATEFTESMAGKPTQVEMLDAPLTGCGASSVGTVPLSFSEPAAGPKDGRYQELRSGGAGAAREVRRA